MPAASLKSDAPTSSTSAIVDDLELEVRGVEARAILVDLCREDINAFCEFVLRDEETGAPIEQLDFHLEIQAALTEHRQVVVMAHPESGKALPLSTEIPTPRGWRTMGSLKPGDQVFGSSGAPCTVTFCTRVQLGRRVFEIEFDDGVVMRADADHQWLVRKRQAFGTRVVTTLEMLEHGLRESDDHHVWSVPVCGAVQYERCRLPIAPYVLGAWLGDGTSAAAALTFAEEDQFVWDECVALVGGRVPLRDRRNPRVMSGTLGDRWGHVRGRLRKMGLIGSKRIPRNYLMAGIEDRRALLAGLLDTDGSVSRGPSGGSSRVELTLCNRELAIDAIELVRSLGFKATIAESDAMLNGRAVGRRWRICFTAREPVFRLPRKLARQQLGGARRTAWRHVTAILEVESEPVRCIAVDSPDRTYLAGRHYTVTHNTNQLAIGRVLWELGRNPNLRVMIIGNTQDGAKKSLQSIKKYIEKSEELHLVFPDLRRGDIWQDVAISVNRPTYSKDASITAVGYGSNNVLGSRVDLMIFDDLLNMEITATEAQRRKVSRWVRTTALARCTKDAMVAFLTNAWHPRDLSQELVKERGWHQCKRPIRIDGKSVWAARWSEERINKRFKDLGSLEFARVFMCEPRDEGDMIFKIDFFVLCKKRGAKVMPVQSLEMVPNGCVVVSGVDIGSRRIAGASTSIFTLLIHPNGTRQPLWIEAGRWGATELLKRVVSTGQRYKGVVAVENNGIQQHLVDLAIESEQDVVSIIPYYTGTQKADPRFGVASLSSELEGGRWIWPDCFPGLMARNVADQLEECVVECLDYTPEQHTGDRLMSMWIAREVGRRIHAYLYGDLASRTTIGAQVLG
jgi:hypothetical protein